MNIKIIEESSEVLPEYEKVSIAFSVETFFRVELIENGLGGIRFFEEKLDNSYIKNYDNFAEDKPANWAKRFDLSNWTFLSAFDGERRIGGAAVAWNTPEVCMLEGREDLACLWDLRVAPGYRGKSVGQFLFAGAIDWARSRNCRLLKVETQNINVPACRFYARQGCELGAINRFAYPELMNETQLIWYLKI